MRDDGSIVKAAFTCENGLGVSQRQNVWQVQEMADQVEIIIQDEREQPWEHVTFLSTFFFLFLKLLYEYQPLLKLIFFCKQSQTPGAAEISSAASISC